MQDRILLLCIFCSLFFAAEAQVTIYSEDFSGYPNATTNSPGMWTSSGTDCDDPGLNNGNQYGVYNGAFTVNEVEGAPCCVPDGGGNDNNWETVQIDISGYCEVQFSLFTTSSGDLECESPGLPLFACQGTAHPDDFHDQMVITYVLDGVPIQAAYICGDNGVGPISVTNIVGNTLLIRIQAANKFGSETYTWDDILIEGFEPQMINLNLPQTVFCENDPPLVLNNVQDGVLGTWSGPGIVGNTFDPDVAGPGNPALTFTPLPGICALPALVQMSVASAPIGFPTSSTACVDAGGLGIFDLTSLNFTIAGGFAAVNWYFDVNLSTPILTPDNFITPVSTTVFAEVLIGGCGSDAVPVDLFVETCDIPTPNLSCTPGNDTNTCTVCENGIFPNETVTLYLNFPFIPPGGFDLTVTYGNASSGYQNQVFPSFMGQPLNFLISETTEFFVSEIICPNGCPDLSDLGDIVTFLYNDQPIITDPGDQSACGTYTLPAISGLNIPANAAYFTQPNGLGVQFLPGDIIATDITLFIYAADGDCDDEASFDITIEPPFDPAWTVPTVPCGSSTILLLPDGDTGGMWTGIGITDNGDGSANFDPNVPGAGDVTYSGGNAPCDAALTQTITVSAGGADTTIIDLNTCDPAAAGSDTLFLMNQAGCDSLVITNTILQFADVLVLSATNCDPMQVGSDTVFLINQFGCDSLIITETLLLPSDITNLIAGSCDPTQVGVDTSFLSNEFGCDSLVITETILLDSDTTQIDQTTCDAGMVGQDTLFLQNQEGCDSLVITTTTLAPSDTLFVDDTSCDLSQVGLDTSFLTNQFGCDSLIITNTTFIDSDTTLILENSCNPLDTGTTVIVLSGSQCDSIIIMTTSLLPSDTLLIAETSCDPADVGLDTVFLTNQLGCDSLIITNTMLVMDDTTALFLSSCNPLDTGIVVDVFAGAQCDSIVITTTTLLASDTTQLSATTCDPILVGTDTLFLLNLAGCDSLVITTTTLLPSDTTTVSLTTCDPMSVGSDSTLLQNQFGCDSLVITNTVLLPSDTLNINESTCDPALVGTDTTFLNNQFGCDSLIITTTTLDPSDTILLTINTCDPAQAGVDTTFQQNQFGCDSLVITATIFQPSDAVQLSAITCDPGMAGSDTLFLQNQFGCDSLLITNTTFVPADTTLLIAGSCNPLDTGVVVEILIGSQCDSVVITTTTLLPSDLIQLQETTCDPLQAGVDTTFLQNQFGCDSLVITSTVLLPSDTTNLSDVTCDPAQAGTFTMILQNQFGCDSTVITQVNLLPTDAVEVQATTCDPVQAGTTVEIFQNQFGCDSTVTTITSLLPSDEVQLSATTCEPGEVGMDTLFLQNQFGCDSLVVTTTTLIPPIVVNNFPTICFGDSILINTTWYSGSNTTGSDTLVSSLGCDSILNVFLNFYPAPQFISVTDALCADEVFEYNGVFYDLNNPNGTQTIQSVETGCDSIVADIQISFETLDVNLSVQPPSCEGIDDGSLTITSIDGIGTPYLYTLDTTALQSLDNLPFTIGNLAAGDYSLQVESTNGCAISLPVFIEDGPEPLVDLGESLLINLGEAVTLKPVINFAYDSIFWSPEELFPCDTCETVTIIPTGSTLVTLMVIDSLGCVGLDELSISVRPERHRYAPNIFSPNFDGVNDKFLIYTDPQQVNRIRTFQIFDRWGEQVFLQNNIDPNDQQAGWDGTFRAEKAPVGVYVYFAEIEYIDGIVEFVKGDVTLVR